MVAGKKVKTNLYLNKELKEKAKQKLDEYGLNLSAFTNLMLAKFLKNDIDLILPDETREVLKDYEIKTLFKAKVCAKCNFTGYKKRKAIGELFIMNDEIKEMIAKGTNDIELKNAMIKNGMKTLKENLLELLQTGETSLKEAIRVGLKD